MVKILRVVDNHIKSSRWHRCWHCGWPTRWVEMNFEAPLHRGRCSKKKEDEYWEAVCRP